MATPTQPAVLWSQAFADDFYHAIPADDHDPRASGWVALCGAFCCGEPRPPLAEFGRLQCPKCVLKTCLPNEPAMKNPKFMTSLQIAGELTHNDRERELCEELQNRIAYHCERMEWWKKNATDIAKERADAWTALLAVEPFMREDMPDGPDGERGCATPEYRNAFRLVLAALKDRKDLLALLTPSAP